MSQLRTVTITGVLLVSLSHSSVLVRWKANPPIIQDAWRPTEHWRYGTWNRGQLVAQRRSFQDDHEGVIKNSIVLSPQSSRDRIKWYQKHCRKTGRFCQQLRQAKSHAMTEYQQKMSTLDKNSRIEQHIVQSIQVDNMLRLRQQSSNNKMRRNPGIGQHLARNMKDYIITRIREDSD